MNDQALMVHDGLVHRLLAAQFPQWAHLPTERVPSPGTDHALFRLGDDLVVRLPRRRLVVEQTEKEQRWLPVLAPHLPLSVPVPVGLGLPSDHFPWHWSVCRWLPGDSADREAVVDLSEAARQLGGFIGALQGIDTSGGPAPGTHNFGRGESLAARDGATRWAIDELADVVDRDAALSTWERVLRAPAWAREPVWIHGDLHGANLLVHGGRLSAVLDFGGMAVADPACDVMVAWTYLTADARRAFRARLAIDDATWVRGLGWALSFGLVFLPTYRDSNPALGAVLRRAIDEALADSG